MKRLKRYVICLELVVCVALMVNGIGLITGRIDNLGLGVVLSFMLLGTVLAEELLDG